VIHRPFTGPAADASSARRRYVSLDVRKIRANAPVSWAIASARAVERSRPSA
jgi:hypothetical protein